MKRKKYHSKTLADLSRFPFQNGLCPRFFLRCALAGIKWRAMGGGYTFNFIVVFNLLETLSHLLKISTK